MYELGLLFIRGPRVVHWQIGYGCINRAMACGHALSRLTKFPVDDVTWLKAEAELSEAHCLMPMFKARVDDVSDRMKYQWCGNPLCVRLVGRDVVRDRKRVWYQEARHGFGAGWWRVRRKLLTYGRPFRRIDVVYRPQEHRCKCCLKVVYCGAACERLHQRQHECDCFRRPAQDGN